MRILRPRKGPLPVVSVGNISFGGTEKTPFVLTLVAALLKNGIKPAVITRGYKGTWERIGGVLSDGKSRSGTWRESGDEPFMVSLNYPEIGVFVGKNRLQSCAKAHNMGFEIAILDDGFQHRRLHRDLDIVLYDPTENCPLREPFSALERADILMFKDNINAEIKKKLSGELPDVDMFTYSVLFEGLYDMNRKKESGLNLKEKRVLAFCGIARPDRFRRLLKSEGIKPVQFIAFPDHHTYPPESVMQIVDFCESQKADICLTTEKDAVKIKGIQVLRDIPTYFLKIRIQTEEALFASVLSQLKTGALSDV